MNYFNKKRIVFGTLYIVSTPIGNMEDITKRSLVVLKKVNYVVAENINRTKVLLKYYNISSSFISMNKYNEKKQTLKILNLLKKSFSIAVVSDAGTPNINDPGLYLIQQCYKYNITIVPVPGPCAAIAALSVSGLSTCQFCYEGFLPSKKNERLKKLQKLKKEKRTIIFYETTHRILDSLNDLIYVFGEDRKVSISKELTKYWEKIYINSANKVLSWMEENLLRKKGELVVIIEGYTKKSIEISNRVKSTCKLINKYLSISKSVFITSKIYNVKKNALYQYMIKKVSDKKINLL